MTYPVKFWVFVIASSGWSSSIGPSTMSHIEQAKTHVSLKILKKLNSLFLYGVTTMKYARTIEFMITNAAVWISADL